MVQNFLTDININGSITNVSNIDFDKDATTPAYKEGGMFYDKVNYCMTSYDDIIGSSLQGGQELRVRVYNGNGVTIPDGAAVTVTGRRPLPSMALEVELAISSDKTSALNTIGIATGNILVGEEGWATTSGVIRDIDTSAYTEGAAIWLSSTVPGAYQEFRPLSPNYEVRMGGVAKSHATLGEIYAELRILDNDHDNSAFSNGCVLEHTHITVTTTPTVSTLNVIEPAAKGYISLIFNQDYTKVSTPISIVLTNGTDVAPQVNYIYFDNLGVITKSLSGFPTAEQYAPVATLVVQSAASVDTYGCYKVHAWTDHLADENGQGHLSHLNAWIRRRPALWKSGIVITATEGSALATIPIAYSSGVVSQLHLHNFPAFNTATGSILYGYNNPTTPYIKRTSISPSIDTDSLGVAIGNGKYYNLVLWGVVSAEDGDCKIMFNLPSGSYSVEADALSDINAHTDFSIPDDYVGTGFLITKLTIQRTNTTVKIITGSIADLRGLFPATGGGGGTIGGSGITRWTELVDTPSTITANTIVVGNSAGTSLEMIARGTSFNKNYSTTDTDIKINGVQSLGVLDTLPRADHVHPTDTTRQPSLSGTGIVKSVAGTISYLTDNSTNWNTAFGWGNHAGLYLPITTVLPATKASVANNFLTSYSSTTGLFTSAQPTIANVSGLQGALDLKFDIASFTDSAVTDKLLTGLNITGTSITSTDSILTAFGKLQAQVTAQLGGLIFQNTWNASTNTPTITSSVGTKGHYYIVGTAGSTLVDGISDWKAKDWIVFNGTTWDKVDNTDSVSSVNGAVGAVSLTTANISELTNLYYTDSRARSAVSLTVIGNSGASTYSNLTGVLNVPTYTLAGLGGQPLLTNPITGTGTVGTLPIFTGTSALGDSSIKEVSGRVLIGATDNGVDKLQVNGDVLATNFKGLATKATDLYHQQFSTPDLNAINSQGKFTALPILAASTNIFPTVNNANAVMHFDMYDGGVGNEFGQLGFNANQKIYYRYSTNSWKEVIQQGTPTLLINTNTDNGVNKLQVNGSILGTALTLSITPTTSASTYEVLTRNTTTGVVEKKASTFFQTALTNPITGTGTTNYLSKFTGASALGDSVIYDNGTNVGIGTTSPGVKLDIIADLSTDAVRIKNTNINGGGLSVFAANGGGGTNRILTLGDSSENIKVAVIENGNVGIGTTSPTALLDIQSGAYSLVVGADNNLSTRTNSVSKTARIGIPHYLSAEEPMGLIYASSGATENILNIGGGTSLFNAPTYIGFYTATNNTTTTGTEAMRINNLGNVGIGTVSPSQKLEVNGNVLINGAAPYISIKTTQTGTPDWKIYNSYNTVGDFAIIGGSSVSNQFNIQPSGNVGIGTTAPGFKLDVNGIIATNNYLYTTNGVACKENTGYFINFPGYNSIGFNTNSTERVRILASGNVGIGTTSPLAKLHVNNGIVGTTSITNNASDYSFYTNAVQTNTFQGLLGTGEDATVTAAIHGFDDGSGAAQGLTFSTGSNSGLLERLRIDSSGNVGIGTTSPSKKLEVAGSYKLGTNAYIQYDAAYPYTITTANTAGVGNLVFSAGLGSAAYESRIDLQGTNVATTAGITLSTAGSSRMVVTNAGNVGIGTTSPGAKLEINDTNKAINTKGNLFVSTTDALAIDKGGQISLGGVWSGTSQIQFAGIAGRKENATSENAGGYLQLSTANSAGGNLTERMRITSEGNVGIGTTSPQGLLHLNNTSNSVSSLLTPSMVISNSLATIGDGITTFNSSRLRWSSGAGIVDFRLQSDYDSIYSGGTIQTASAHPIRFAIGSAEKIRLSINGNLSINTTDDNGVDKLQVSGSGYFNNGTLVKTTGYPYGSSGGFNSGGYRTIIPNNLNAYWMSLALQETTGTFQGGIQIIGDGTEIRLYQKSNFLRFVGNNLIGTSITATNFYGNLVGSASQLGGYDYTKFGGYTASVADIKAIGGQNLYTLFSSSNNPTNSPNGGPWVSGIQFADANNPTYRAIIAVEGSDLYFTKQAAGVWGAWTKIIRQGTPTLLINTTDDNGVDKLQVIGSIKATSSVQVGDNVAVASASNVGSIRYRTSGNNSYSEMCMQTGASTYAWTTIVENNW